MEFKYEGITVRCVNPEVLSIAKNKLAKLIIEMAQYKINKENKEV